MSEAGPTMRQKRLRRARGTAVPTICQASRVTSPEEIALLGPAEVRRRATALGHRPTKTWGQNFVVDANTVRRIARISAVGEDDVVVEVGPGLGSLTLALLETGARVVAVEIDPVLAAALPRTVAERAAPAQHRFTMVHADALRMSSLPGPEPTALVANLPYNVAVPVLLTFLERFPSLRSALVMVQAEVAERLAAAPGEPAYGAPSVKAAWYAHVRRAGAVARTVFWPVPRVESGLVRLDRRDPPVTTVSRAEVFACVDAAFAQRRKTLRAALAGWAGSAPAVEEACAAAGIDPTLRGERLSVVEFTALAEAHARRAGISGTDTAPAGVLPPGGAPSSATSEPGTVSADPGSR